MGFCLFNNVAVAAAHALGDAAPSGSWSSTGTSTTATGPRRSSPTPTRCCTRASTSRRSIRARARRTTSARGGGGLHGQPAGAARLGVDEFLALVQHVVVPIARAFEPGLVAISAGYDAHRDDPLADCRVDTAAFGDMAATMRRPRPSWARRSSSAWRADMTRRRWRRRCWPRSRAWPQSAGRPQRPRSRRARTSSAIASIGPWRWGDPASWAGAGMGSSRAPTGCSSPPSPVQKLGEVRHRSRPTASAEA